MMISKPSYPPESFQKAMVFIDGTNLFYRLESKNLKISLLKNLFPPFVAPRRIARAYLYTVEQHLTKAKKVHGENFCDGIRVVLGEGIQKKDGNVKEKGVDALLVADMVYHAASRNCEYALVVTVDTDFVYVLRRVEDFGCRTAVLSVCCPAPDRLRDACDDYHEVNADDLIKGQFGVEVKTV
jgi:uncharacterized LabA/DUF88 family protein